MPKVTEDIITITGSCGKEYDFEIYTIDTDFDETGGVYLFTHRYLVDGKYDHSIVYIGRTADLSTIFQNHHKRDCIEKNQANCICIHRADSEEEQIEIENDLLVINTVAICNDVAMQ